jgi:predicted nucleotidyltransferase
VHHWPGHDAASRLRVWPALVELVERIEASDVYEAGILVGSLARGEADDFSDIDFLVLIRDDRWEEAWSRRDRLSAEALYVWDEPPEDGREIAKRGWLTRDFVLVECPHSTRAGGHRLADPFAVIAGDPKAAYALPRRPPIAREELQAYVDQLDREGKGNDVQRRYDDLVRALRRNRSTTS